jgi:RimJ/RimL family protein N-acetyltransferase
VGEKPIACLLSINDDVLERLLATAVTDADPAEVMAPVAGPAGWTAQRQDAFRAFHRARRGGLTGALHESTFAVAADGRIVGSARLELKEPGTLEAGLWLARSARGRGIGTAVLQALLEEAARAGAATVAAETTMTNTAAVNILRHSDGMFSADKGSGHVHAEIRVMQPPVEPTVSQ